MIDKIIALEKTARQLEPSQVERKTIWEQGMTYIEDFIETLPLKKAYQAADCPQLSNLVITEEAKPFEQLLAIVREEVDHAGINSASGGHLGYIPGGALWASAIGDLLVAATNRYAGIFFSCPGAVIMENQLIRWLCSLVGFPATAHGNLSSGGSIASLIAITTARDQHGIQAEKVRSAVIYFTQQMHHCLHKALHITGLGEAVFRIIPMNAQYQMDIYALENQLAMDVAAGLRPFMVIATAGTTDTGAMDELDAIASICEQYQAWFHVDAAYGGFFILVDELKEKFKGIERADSLVMDPHKGLFLPFGTGVALIKDGQALLAAHAHQAAYMVDAYGFEEINPADCGPELTKHFRGLRMWLPLHLHGLSVFRDCLAEKLLLCRYFHERIQEMGFETGPYPALSITLFRYPAEEVNAFNQRLLAALHRDGRFFFSSTLINGEVWIRCAVLNFRTHLQEIRLALEMIGEHLVVVSG
ncbi:MAG: aminotransferase class V-fold PLP-dependent enzyme [Saprospiraceae bacterium]